MDPPLTKSIPPLLLFPISTSRLFLVPREEEEGEKKDDQQNQSKLRVIYFSKIKLQL